MKISFGLAVLVVLLIQLKKPQVIGGGRARPHIDYQFNMSIPSHDAKYSSHEYLFHIPKEERICLGHYIRQTESQSICDFQNQGFGTRMDYAVRHGLFPE